MGLPHSSSLRTPRSLRFSLSNDPDGSVSPGGLLAAAGAVLICLQAEPGGGNRFGPWTCTLGPGCSTDLTAENAESAEIPWGHSQVLLCALRVLRGSRTIAPTRTLVTETGLLGAGSDRRGRGGGQRGSGGGRCGLGTTRRGSGGSLRARGSSRGGSGGGRRESCKHSKGLRRRPGWLRRRSEKLRRRLPYSPNRRPGHPQGRTSRPVRYSRSPFSRNSASAQTESCRESGGSGSVV